MSAPLIETSNFDAIIAHTMGDAPRPERAAPAQPAPSEPAAEPVEQREAAPEAEQQTESETQQPEVAQPQVSETQEPTFTREQVVEMWRLMQQAQQQPQVKQEPPKPQEPQQTQADKNLDAFYKALPDQGQRKEFMRAFMGSLYEEGAENDRRSVALMESHLIAKAETAKLAARWDAFEAQQRQAAERAALAARQSEANNIFQTYLSQFAEVSPHFQEALADMVLANQHRGMDIRQATAAAFETGKQLGLRLKGQSGRPSQQQLVVQGRDKAAAVTRTPTGSPPKQESAKSRTINDILKQTFGG